MGKSIAQDAADLVGEAAQGSAKEEKDFVKKVLQGEDITLETKLEKLMGDVSAVKEILKTKHAAEKHFDTLGAPEILKPTEAPPVFNPNMATVDDSALGNQFGNYSAWVAYFKNYVAMKEIDIIFTQQALVKTERLLAKKYRAGGSGQRNADDLVGMDTTILALQDLLVQFQIERKMADGNLGPYQDYIKALSREITRRQPDRFNGSGTLLIAGETFTGEQK